MILTGLVLLNLAVVGGIAAIVYARAHRNAHEALRDDLSLRAKTLSGLAEIGPDGPALDLPVKVMPEYVTPRSGAYVAVYDSERKPQIRSPSLGRRPLGSPVAWEEGAFVFDEADGGPDATPIALVTHSFVVQAEAEEGADGAWRPPTPEQRRWQVVVAADSRPRDAGLRALVTFLAITGAAALGATALGGLLVARYVLTPIRRMTDEAAQLTPEEPSRRLEPASVVRELESLAETLNSALDRLEDALDRQRRFASDASHELRTPLAVLLGNAELLLRRERSTPEYRKGLERQRRIAQRMTRITENLLVLARADAGRERIQRTRVALGGLTREVCDELLPLAAEGGVALACETDDSVATVGDPTYLEGLLQNLLANAVKFTPPGGRVRVALSRSGGDALLEVADTGPGIPAEHQARIFERFYRVNGGNDQREGAGLGLAIVAWIVRAHDGRIEVRSELGKGTTFSVRLPLARESAAPVESGA